MHLKSTKLAIAVFLIAISSYATGNSSEAVHDLVQRLIPQHASKFSFETIPQEESRDVFEIVPAEGNHIVVRGSSPIAMSSGFNWYLKHVANCHVSWCGDQLDLPDLLPKPIKTIRRVTPYKYGYAFNYCTYSYTMAWWDWERWEREIDYMALCGINMPLAIVGSEAIWLNFLKNFGYTHEEAKEFVSGPGYTAWWMMGNLEGRGGPVSDEWIASRIRLQKKILKRMRQLGMKPALPGFVGIVPSDFSKKNPQCKTLPQGRWGGKNIRPHVLHPDDPLFSKAARVWYDELEKLYGKADAFAGDLFHEGGNTHGLDIGKTAKQVQQYMLEHNPDAVWSIQGWQGNPKRKLLQALSKDNTLVVELCCEFYRNWKKTRGFYGYPWTFSTIIMYGGNVGLHGRLQDIHDNLNDALASDNPPVALGTTWESIEVNPVVMDYIWDLRWRTQSPDLEEWLNDYTIRRYGKELPEVKQAWQKLLKTGYGSHPGLRRPKESIFCARPSLKVKKVSPFAATTKIQYDQRELRDAANLLLAGSAELANVRTYQFDLLDVTRQFLANAGQVAYDEMVAAFKQKDLASFNASASTFLEMMKDQDDLLASEELYLLGRWLHDSRRLASTKEQADQNERNARLLITVWNEEKSRLRDYAWKEWSGMLKSFYMPRWALYIKELRNRLSGKKGGPIDFYAMELAWAHKYLEEDDYPHEASGNPIEKSKKIMNKWGPWLDEHYFPKKTIE